MGSSREVVFPEGDDEHLHWRALGDPTRRRILDLLRLSPRTTGQVAQAFPISRIAVMKHLDVLSESGLVTDRKRGRERWHYVNLAPLMRLHKRWANPTGEALATGLLHLKDAVESQMTAEVSAIDIAVDVDIAAQCDVVFDAIVATPAAWWGHPYLRPETTSLTIEPTIGGQLIERWDDGAMVMATITGLTRQRWLQLTGPFHLGPAMVVAEFDLSETAGGCRVSLTFRGAGLLDPAMVSAFSDGWRELLTVRLKALVERGTRLGIDPGD